MSSAIELSTESYIKHFGVKGMKWGVRNDDSVSGSNPPKRIPNRQIKYEARALKKGASKEEAAEIARKKVIRDRVLIGAAVVVGLGVTAYIVNDKVQKDFRSIDLPANTLVNHIHKLGDDVDIDRRLYVTTGKKDGVKYSGIYAKALRKRATSQGLEAPEIRKLALRTTERIKAPSNREAAKLYNEWRFSSSSNRLSLPPDYREFNALLVRSGNKNQSPGRGFDQAWYDILKKKGYNAILDTNDQHDSGYNTRAPLILFNAKSSTTQVTNRPLDASSISRDSDAADKAILGHLLVTTHLPFYGAIAASVVGVKAVSNTVKKAQVNKYKKQHPQTRLSDAEIWKMLYKKP